MSRANRQRLGGPARIVAFYASLIVVLVLAVAFVLGAGAADRPPPSIAGGYDVSSANPCAGAQLEVRQSGQFVSLSGDSGGVTGKLRFEDGRVRGDVTCVDGSSAPLDLLVEGRRLRGTVGGRPLEAVRRRDPPEPGAPTRVPGDIAGEYRVTPRSECLGTVFEVEVGGERGRYELREGQAALGELRYAEGVFSGRVRCPEGGERDVAGIARDRRLTLTLTGAGEPSERVAADRTREFGHTLAALFIAIAIVMLAARLMGSLAVRVGQPRVMGEVLAGILLGPTLLGVVAPELQAAIFPSDVIPYIGAGANLGLIFYMFLVGLEIDTSQLRGRVVQAAAISNAGVLLPMAAGLLVALPIFARVGPDGDFLPFALFMGVAMSITAFPVLARILVERRMLKRPVGALALGSAAIDDVSAWFLIALATAVATAGSASGVLRTIALAVAFCLLMGLVVRPVIGRVAGAYEEAGRVPGGWITAIFAMVLLSAYATETIGIALIFGAFIAGAIMPRHAGLTEDVTRRMEDFVVTLLLPLFFAYTGLRTDVALLDRTELLGMLALIIAVAISCKWGGCMIAAKVTGMSWRDSAVIGALMNTRGLTELIVLNLALEKGVISEALFAILVVMALVTTFMTGPMLRLLDPRNELGMPLEAELDEARRASLVDMPVPLPESSVLVAAETDAQMRQLLVLAEPLGRSEPPRELILLRAVRPPRTAAVRGGLQTQQRLLEEATHELAAIRRRLLDDGVAARAAPVTSVEPGRDIARLADLEEVDFVFVAGRRALLGEGVPRGDVGVVLEQAPSDVAVLVAPEGAMTEVGSHNAVMVPFGGAEHDWAALELGAWIAAANDASLRLLGIQDPAEPDADPSRLLASASLVVQRLTGIATEPLVSEPSRDAIVRAAQGAGLLVIGLSDRWRQEGLGATRSHIARAAPAPILFVRRGTRAGALASREDITRFTWSLAGHGPPPLGR